VSLPYGPRSFNIFRCANRNVIVYLYFVESQECRSAGCRTLAEAKIHIEQKRKKEYELNAQKAKESSHLIANNKLVQKMNRPMKIESDGNLDPKKGGTGLDSPKTTGLASVKHWDDWDVVGLPGAELLSASVSAFQISVPCLVIGDLVWAY
jgi:hypothetical protein